MHRLLVCFGNAEHGRLGLGPGVLSSVTVPRVCMALAKYDLDSVAAGGAHTAVVTRGGLLFTFGLNNMGQLGHSPGSACAGNPGIVMLPEPVTAVAAGDAHTLCLTESGKVYAFGCNTAGQLGIGRDSGDDPSSRPGRGTAEPRLVEVLAGLRVVALAAGSSHSLAVSERGHLYAWGTAANGRLGLGGAQRRPGVEGGRNAAEPQVAVHQAAKAAAEAASTGTTPRGSGNGAHGGGGDGGGDGGGGDPWVEWLPRRVVCSALAGLRLVNAFAGPATSACTDEHGRVYTWGSGRLHQLGHGGNGGDEWEPRLVNVPSLRRTVRLSLGASHALACREDERVHVWGSDPSRSGCLGQGSMPGPGLGPARPPGQGPVTLSRPTIFKFWFTDVAAGLAHSAGISSDGRLYTWGWGGGVSGTSPLQSLRLARLNDGTATDAVGDGAGGGGAGAQLRLGAGQLGVGAGADLPTPTLVTKLEILPGEVFRQDNGDPFNYQDSNLGWLFRRVACGHNHTAAIIQVARSWRGALRSAGQERRVQVLSTSDEQQR